MAEDHCDKRYSADNNPAQQGLNLGKKTHNRVYGEVRSRAFDKGKKIELRFDVVAPLLGYQETIFKATHNLTNYYPVQLVHSELAKSGSQFTEVTAQDQLEFKDKLRAFLQDDKIMGVINALFAQSITAAADEDPE